MESAKYKKIFTNVKEMAFAFLPTERGDMRCFHFSAIYKGKRLISASFNAAKTHPKNLEYDYKPNAACHAEIRSVLKARKEDFSGYSIYVMRIDRNDKVNTSKPCSGCEHLIKSLNFKEVYATNKIGMFEKIEY